MATTDARTGFRLPWSSDQRSQTDDDAATPAADAGPATSDARPAEAVIDAVADEAPEGSKDMETAPAVATGEVGAETAIDTGVEETAADPVDSAEAVAPVPGARSAKRPNKFLADLTKAMQAAAESAREEAMTRLQADAKGHIEAIHERSATDAADLRRKADDDVAAIREWSKAEIARIREETDQKISARKGNLEFEIEEHAARIERQIEHVQGRVGAFETDMAEFFERLLGEEDPTRFAALAENLPEPPPFDLDELAASAWLASTTAPDEAPPTGAAEEATDAGAVDAVVAEDPEAAMAAIEAAAEAVGWGEMNEAEAAAVAEPVEAQPAEAQPAEATDAPDGDESDPRLSAIAVSADFEAAEAEALEAAGSADESEEIPTIGDDALAARLAGLVPAHEDEATSTETRATQVMVSGLVSVASIASFKRHLGRLAGVHSVGVSSGPEGEFVFAVNHGPDVDLREAVPSLPGFQARVTGGTDTNVEVTARDPESEG